MYDEKEGPGHYVDPSGKIYVGEWVNGVAKCGFFVSSEQMIGNPQINMLNNDNSIIDNTLDIPTVLLL